MIYSEDFIRWCHWGYIAAAIICAQIDNCCSLIAVEPPNPTVGQNVLLNVEYNGKILMINWYKGDGTSQSMSIVTLNPQTSDPPTTGKMFTGREKVMNNGSLLISNLRTSDAGSFTVQLSIPGSFMSDTVPLTVNEAETPPPVIGVSGRPTQVLPVSPHPNLNPTASEPKANVNQVVIGAVIGSVIVVFLSVTAVIVYFKKYRKPVEKPPLDKPKFNEDRRLPSLPPRPYQNERGNHEEQPYEDLAYVYSGSSYHDLNGPPRNGDN